MPSANKRPARPWFWGKLPLGSLQRTSLVLVWFRFAGDTPSNFWTRCASWWRRPHHVRVSFPASCRGTARCVHCRDPRTTRPYGGLHWITYAATAAQGAHRRVDASFLPADEWVVIAVRVASQTVRLCRSRAEGVLGAPFDASRTRANLWSRLCCSIWPRCCWPARTGLSCAQLVCHALAPRFPDLATYEDPLPHDVWAFLCRKMSPRHI